MNYKLLEELIARFLAWVCSKFLPTRPPVEESKELKEVHNKLKDFLKGGK
jgi:hypothetical protein